MHTGSRPLKKSRSAVADKPARRAASRLTAGKRVVDFLLAIIEFFSLALTAAALLSEICRNQRFPTGVGHFERKFQGESGVVHQRILASKLESLGYHVVLFA